MTPSVDSQEQNRVAKGGDAPDLTGMSNFLATDKVPDTLFGIPVVSRREDYTEADLRFFKDHPEAGGYYDMGEETPEDGSAEGAPVQADGGGRDALRIPRRVEQPGKRAARQREVRRTEWNEEVHEERRNVPHVRHAAERAQRDG